MLRRLIVENYALIDQLELELGEGLNIITGETGAGKSILLGALGLLLGGRSELTAIKDKAKNCVVEGVFEIEGYALEDFFENYDLDYDPSCIVRRVITPAGKSRAFINELPVQISTLKEFGMHLIDIHSQHQTLLLTDDKFRLKILDSTATSGNTLLKYSAVYQNIKLLEHQLDDLTSQQAQAQGDESFLRFQLAELAEASLKEDEKEALEAQLLQMSNSEQIKEALALYLNSMENEMGGVLGDLKSAETAFDRCADVFSSGKEFAQRVHSCLVELKDLHQDIELKLDSIDSDPALMQKVSDRLDLLYALEQKHRVSSVGELIELRDAFQAKLNTLDNFTEQIDLIEGQLASERVKAVQLADKITESRRKVAGSVAKYVKGVLVQLGMPTACFEVVIEPLASLCSSGQDMVRFMFASASGLELQSIEKVASGGELSRVMLAIKGLVAQKLKLPTIIFDEIDTGVSGRIANAMGDIISSLGSSMQVINITHLPQVASKGDNHYVVYKTIEGGTTRTNIRKLDREARVDEIAKMLSGDQVTQAARDQALELLGNG